MITGSLATFASAIFLYQILEPTSFLSAVRGAEINAIPRATWEKIYQELQSRLNADPVAREHAAVSKLMKSLATVQPGPLPEDVKREIPYLVRADSDNLHCRLSVATLQDFEYAAVSPKERFENIQRIVEAAPRASGSRLYNEEFTRTWHEILKKHIRRADVAASAAVTLNHYEIVDHYAALPKMQRRLSELAGELRTQGHSAEADACNRWLGKTLLGLIDLEKDAGMRLLCLELMQKTEPDNQVAGDLAALREAYYAHADAAPIDPTHPYRPPVANVQDFHQVWASVIAAATVCLTSIGAFFVLIVVGLALTVRTIAGKTQVPTQTSGSRTMLRAAGIGIASAAFMAVVCIRATWAGPYSMSWAALLALGIVGWGTLTVALVLASGVTTGESPRVVPLVIVALAMIGLWSLAGMAPGPVVSSVRRINLATGNLALVMATLGIVALSSSLLVLKDWRFLARTASFVWMTIAIFALAILQYHLIQDRRWTPHSAEARLDEFPARLGPDWQEKYLQSVRAAYDIPRP